MAVAALSDLELSIEDFLQTGPPVDPRLALKYQTVVGLLQELLKALNPQMAPTTKPLVIIPTFPIVNIKAASTATPLATGGTLVRASLVQNIATNPVTLGGSGVAVGQGYILNAASATGSAGDTVTIVPPPGYDLVDISQIYFNQTGTGATISRMDF